MLVDIGTLIHSNVARIPKATVVPSIFTTAGSETLME